MERGPLALFGAIVAVGLGPALWLGAQLGQLDIAPPVPPASVGQQHSDSAVFLGGSGAGDTATGHDTTVRTTPRAHILPLTSGRSTPSAGSSRTTGASPSTSVTATPTPSLGSDATPSPSGGPSSDGTTAPTPAAPPPTTENAAPSPSVTTDPIGRLLDS